MKRFEADLGRLFDGRGRRKYLCEPEGLRFLKAAAREDARTRAFCRLLAYGGSRISEALALEPEGLDPDGGVIVFRTLKRRRLTYRAVPIPDDLMDELVAICVPGCKLFPWCRQTAWRRVKRVMAAAGISGPQAVPKGLRHRFGVRAAGRNVPTTLTQRWMGHARAETTAIYQQAVGPEEREFAARMWPD